FAPMLANAAADKMPGHGAQPLGIEGPQIDNIDGHGGIVSRTCLEFGRSRWRPVRVTVRQTVVRGAAMPAETKLFRCLKDNYGVLIHDPATGATAAIDAPEAAPIEAALQATGWKLTDILVTHHHADHTDGIADLKKKYHCRVVAPKAEAAKIPLVDETVSEGDKVSVGKLTANVIETPGHTLGHITYWFHGDKLAFA